MAGPVSGAHLNPAVRLVRNFCIIFFVIFCHFFCLPYHHTSTLQLGCFAIFLSFTFLLLLYGSQFLLSFTFLLLLLYGSQDLFSSTFLLLYHHYVLVFTHCKYSPFTSTALAAVGKFDWKKVKPNFSKTDICVFCVFVFKWCFFPLGAIIPIYPAWSLYTCTIPGCFPRRGLGVLYL